MTRVPLLVFLCELASPSLLNTRTLLQSSPAIPPCTGEYGRLVLLPHICPTGSHD